MFNIGSFNRKKEELLAIESLILFLFMQSKHGENIIFDEQQFEEKYPQFCGSDIYLEEKKKLFEFCNCVRFLLFLIPAKNNKEHILDLVTRVVEGYSVRYITGTGMTKETRRRYEIIHIEGNLTKMVRPERRVDKSLKPPKIPKKRGRPLSVRCQ